MNVKPMYVVFIEFVIGFQSELRYYTSDEGPAYVSNKKMAFIFDTLKNAMRIAGPEKGMIRVLFSTEDFKEFGITNEREETSNS